MHKQVRILFIVEQCNPEWPSVPLVAYHLWDALAQKADVHLVTHARNREALEKNMAARSGLAPRRVDYIEEPRWLKQYYSLVHALFGRGGSNWPLLHVASYPIYAYFNHAVYKEYAPLVRAGNYDIVHAFTPVLPRYPVSLAQLASPRPASSLDAKHHNPQKDIIPFVLGPVNGGLPFPPAFSDVRRKEGGRFEKLRALTRLLPNYTATYENASLILVGSRYTQTMLAERFPKAEPKLKLFHENGLSPAFFRQTKTAEGANEGQRERPLRLLFVGRLVPYKGADMVLEAMKQCQEYVKHDESKAIQDGNSRTRLGRIAAMSLSIVGDGPEHAPLQALAHDLSLPHVHFTGQEAPENMAEHYATADIFVFPSVREFGGAVVLEAMASGLPCIVVNHGGIGEYVHDDCGIRIEPRSRDYIIKEVAAALYALDGDRDAIQRLGKAAKERVAAYAWSRKADWLMQEYDKLL